MKELGCEQDDAQFSKGDSEGLVKRGFAIYRLGEQSVSSIRAGYKDLFTSFYSESYPDFEKQTSIRSEVAACTSDFYLTGSNWKSLAEQTTMVENITKNLQLDGLAVKAIIGQAQDYVEYALQHFERSGQKVNGVDLEDSFIRTSIRLNSGRNVHLKNLNEFPKAILAYDWDASYGHKDVYVVPLIIPISR